MATTVPDYFIQSCSDFDDLYEKEHRTDIAFARGNCDSKTADPATVVAAELGYVRDMSEKIIDGMTWIVIGTIQSQQRLLQTVLWNNL